MAAEQLIQFIWKYSLLSGQPLITTCGQKLEVLDPGEQNYHAGPDFFTALIRLEQMIWAGNVEIHGRASDWYRHGHHLDPAYNNVILHVVGIFDTDVTNSLGRRIHTLVSDNQASLEKRYEVLKKSESWLPCGGRIRQVPPWKLNRWLIRLQKERANQKYLRMEQFLSKQTQNLDEALYLALSSGYGLPVNALPFELLAKGIPYSVLMDHRDNQTDLEAILLGQSGMLFPSRALGAYPSSLWNRYSELKNLLIDQPVPGHLWRFLRLRPASFPTLRISQFASLFNQSFPTAQRILDCASITEMEQNFRTAASEYWTTHYLFGKTSPPFPKFPGEQFIRTLIINVIVPYLDCLHKVKGRNSAGIQADEILQNLKAENNEILKNWGIFGIRAGCAGESQALLHLYQVYCKQKRCLDCQIGADLVITAIHEQE